MEFEYQACVTERYRAEQKPDGKLEGRRVEVPIEKKRIVAGGYVADSLGRKWQLGTIQLDYAAGERFGLEYVGEDNAPHRPVVIHRAVNGSFERFIAILIEHFAGAFPVWLAPIQVAIVTVTDRVNAHARDVMQRLEAAGVRVAFDDGNGTMQAKVREASLQKILARSFFLITGVIYFRNMERTFADEI